MNELEQKLEQLESSIGRTDEESRRIFGEAMAWLKENESEEIKQRVAQVMLKAIAKARKEAEKEKEKPVPEPEMLPLAYIARTYFKRSKSWLQCRLYGKPVKGKVYTFTEEEKATFNRALKEIAEAIQRSQLS